MSVNRKVTVPVGRALDASRTAGVLSSGSLSKPGIPDCRAKDANSRGWFRGTPMRMSHARVQGEPAIANRPGDAMFSSSQREPEPDTGDDEPEGDVDDLPRPALVGLAR